MGLSNDDKIVTCICYHGYSTVFFGSTVEIVSKCDIYFKINSQARRKCKLFFGYTESKDRIKNVTQELDMLVLNIFHYGV